MQCLAIILTSSHSSSHLAGDDPLNPMGPSPAANKHSGREPRDEGRIHYEHSIFPISWYVY